MSRPSRFALPAPRVSPSLRRLPSPSKSGSQEARLYRRLAAAPSDVTPTFRTDLELDWGASGVLARQAEEALLTSPRRVREAVVPKVFIHDLEAIAPVSGEFAV